MRTRLELILEVEHPEDYNPADHFVHYFDDEAPEPEEIFVVVENWSDV